MNDKKNTRYVEFETKEDGGIIVKNYNYESIPQLLTDLCVAYANYNAIAYVCRTDNSISRRAYLNEISSNIRKLFYQLVKNYENNKDFMETYAQDESPQDETLVNDTTEVS